MSESTSKKKRLRGAAGLWLAVAVLALAYLAVWSIDKTPGSLPQGAGSLGEVAVPTLPSASQDALAEQAKRDASTRSPGAQIEVESVQPTFVMPGPELRETSGDVGRPGAVITLGVVRDGRLTERVTYRAMPPDQVVFIEQKPAN